MGLDRRSDWARDLVDNRIDLSDEQPYPQLIGHLSGLTSC